MTSFSFANCSNPGGRNGRSKGSFGAISASFRRGEGGSHERAHQRSLGRADSKIRAISGASVQPSARMFSASSYGLTETTMTPSLSRIAIKQAGASISLCAIKDSRPLISSRCGELSLYLSTLSSNVTFPTLTPTPYWVQTCTPNDLVVVVEARIKRDIRPAILVRLLGRLQARRYDTRGRVHSCCRSRI